MALAPPVTNGKFSFSVDSFYVSVESTNKNDNLHRRAAPAEIQALYQPVVSGSQKVPDPVGHWYEAQLIHYGLTPSKTKAVSKMRLLDACKNGYLVVPLEI